MSKNAPSLLLLVVLAIAPAITCVKAYRTNESSYQYGFKGGRAGYDRSNFNADLRCVRLISIMELTMYEMPIGSTQSPVAIRTVPRVPIRV
jgi:hypothetical protein